ncbi:MAG: hypothetical protein ACPLTR_00905 [Thermacetogeniaceae bacterium]
MFGISEFNEKVLEHPEILVSINEEEEEEDEFMCFPLQSSFVDAEGAAPVAVVFVLICLIASLLDRVYFTVQAFIRSHGVQAGLLCAAFAIGCLWRVRTRRKGV